MLSILHGINLKCGKKCRNEYIGILDAYVLFFIRVSIPVVDDGQKIKHDKDSV